MSTSDRNARSCMRLLFMLLLAAALTGCDSKPGCRPTRTAAREAAVINTIEVSDSGVLRARLTTLRGTAIAKRTVHFWMAPRNTNPTKAPRMVGVGTAVTDKAGWARVDLKARRDVNLAWDLTSDRFGAIFGGDKTYCFSQDDARFSPAIVGATRVPPPPAPPLPAPAASVPGEPGELRPDVTADRPTWTVDEGARDLLDKIVPITR